MKWFEGGIAEAVNASKEKNAVFVVFVEGKDDASKKTTEAINNPEVSAKLQGSGYVAIRIESDTTAHQQFAQIYQIVPVPSLFFIGNSGLPIEILAGATDSQTLLGRLDVVEAVHAGRQAPSAASSSASTAATSTTGAASSAPTERQATKPPSATATSSAVDETAPVSTAPVAPTSSGTSEMKAAPEAAPIEERVERAKELLERKRLEKMREEQEEQRRKEIERRKMGKDVQEMKRQQQDQEMKLLQEQRRKEKEEDALARQRVLDQIAQDRANRNAQMAAATAPRPESSTSTSELTRRNPPRVNEGTARLQFRFPDGSTHTRSFEATSNFGQVVSYVADNLRLRFRYFALSTTFPRRVYEEQDNASTLQDLGLVPTAVLMVIPHNGAGVVQNARPGWRGISGTINDALWAVLSPVFMVLTYLRTRLFGDRQIDQGDRSATATSQTAETSTSSSDARKEKRNKRSSTGGTVRRTGSSNIHRLHQNHSSSDDDNNTWNGNSTQQM